MDEEHDQLYKALYFITGNREDAEDIAQEAFLMLWEGWDSIDRIDDDRVPVPRRAERVPDASPTRGDRDPQAAPGDRAAPRVDLERPEDPELHAPSAEPGLPA